MTAHGTESGWFDIRTGVRSNRVEIQGHFKYLGSITQGNGGQDREIQSRINAASQVPQKVSFHVQPRGLEL